MTVILMIRNHYALSFAPHWKRTATKSSKRRMACLVLSGIVSEQRT